MRTRTLAAIAATVMLAACSGGGSGTTAAAGGDDGSEATCRHFRNIAGDASDGILTDEELRAKLKEVDDMAVIASTDIRDAARELLATVTSGTDAEQADAINALGEACRDAGF